MSQYHNISNDLSNVMLLLQQNKMAPILVLGLLLQKVPFDSAAVIQALIESKKEVKNERNRDLPLPQM
jgi:phage terminase Nu1 subunit (DNA packaging protein)